MPINVSEALDRDTAERVTVARQTGSYADGIFVKGASTTFKTLASVQQPTRQQLQTLPEGERTKDSRLFISKKVLRAGNDKDGTIADIVTHKGIQYKIVGVGDWSSYGHSSVIGVRD